MKLRIINESKVKLISVIVIAMLIVSMVGLTSVSAAINVVETNIINKLIYGNDWYSSDTFDASETYSFYSMPTYGNLVDKEAGVNGEGKYCLGLDKDGFFWGTEVLGRDLYLYSRMANTTDSVFLGKTSGKKLSFSVYSRDGSDGAKFRLKKFRGEYRN